MLADCLSLTVQFYSVREANPSLGEKFCKLFVFIKYGTLYEAKNSNINLRLYTR